MPNTIGGFGSKAEPNLLAKIRVAFNVKQDTVDGKGEDLEPITAMGLDYLDIEEFKKLEKGKQEKVVKVLQGFLENPKISKEEIKEVHGLQDQDEELGYFQFVKLAYDTAIVSFLKSFETYKEDFVDEKQYIQCVILDVLYHFLKAANAQTESSLTDEEIFEKMREKVQSLSLGHDEIPSFRSELSGFPRSESSENEFFPHTITSSNIATPPISSILPFALFGASSFSRSMRGPESMEGDTVDGRFRMNNK